MTGDPTQRPHPDGDDVADFIAHVAAAGGWITARQLREPVRLGIHMDERTLRELAHRSRGRVISGQMGYKATELATTAEVDHAVAWLRSQARAMNDRADQITAEALRARASSPPPTTWEPWFDDAPDTVPGGHPHAPQATTPN